MEKKTMGAFIAALRKANGMTQRELAEKLNVSDKSVSRWERDEGAPDLTMIPVIAEIFDVTCDELLRGQRKSPAEREVPKTDQPAATKGEKQIRHLLKSALAQYRNLTLISGGITALGLIAALICNFAFTKAQLGFLVGLIFYVVSFVCQAVFANKAFAAVEDAEAEASELSAYKQKVIDLAGKFVMLSVVCIGFTLPMLLVYDAYAGLFYQDLLIFGTLFALVGLLAYAVVRFILHPLLMKKGIYTMPEKQLAAYWHNRKLKIRCAAVLMVLLTVTFAFHPKDLRVDDMPGTIFNDYESFTEYMNRDEDVDAVSAAMGADSMTAEIIYFDSDGNPVSEEAALKTELYDANGEVVCTYMHRNRNVYTVVTTLAEGSVLPLRVITWQDYQQSERIFVRNNLLYSALYLVEVAAVLFYYKKKAK